jgi:2,3-bisphosphoglycerate-independent phosphoglycerate mutase
LKKILLLILDGWGYAEPGNGNAIELANTPNMEKFYRSYPWALLDASGKEVGLPAGQMGNSEVGHLNLGAGRIVFQELTRISNSIVTGDFFLNKTLIEAMERAQKKQAAVHLIGLVSNGGVHSHFEHLLGLLEMARRLKIKRLYIHAILDGRDTIPFGARPYLERLESLCAEKGTGCIASVSGRYYAMDRDKRWDRVKKAYQVYAYGDGMKASSSLQALDEAYDRGEGDEFVQPTVIVKSNQQPVATINDEDSLIFFNFRPDRVRQLSRSFTDRDFNSFDRGDQPPLPYCVTMTEYDRSWPLPVAFANEDLQSTLGEVYGREKLAQMRIAETEKYAHVTFFFSGGREEPFPLEDRILVPSPKVPTYDLKPEMSAPEVTNHIIETITLGKHQLLIANFANADMVGHSGDIRATVTAIETVDRSIGQIAEKVLAEGWTMIICADHGNAESMLNEGGETLTAHSTNPVPLILISRDHYRLRKKGILADVAPTILALAGLDKPAEMTGESMIVNS